MTESPKWANIITYIDRNPSFRQIAQTLRSGYVLTSKELKDCFEANGQARNNAAYIRFYVEGGRFKKAFGFDVGIERVGRNFIFFDSSLDKSETDYDEVVKSLKR